jgi:hypothetical protein
MWWKWWKKHRPRWIPVSEALPPDGRWHWVWRKRYGIDIARRKIEGPYTLDVGFYPRPGGLGERSPAWAARKGWIEHDNRKPKTVYVTHWWSEPITEPKMER